MLGAMISIIIPVYNRARTLERSVRSVLNQTISDIEIIVVDDCSDDEIMDVLTRIDDERVRYIRLKMRSGACVARNKGIEFASGDFIAFQDSDDEWVSNKLEIQLNVMMEHHADICFCQLRRHYVGESAKIVLWPEATSLKDGFVEHITLRRKSYASTQTIVAKKRVFSQVLFDPKVIKSQDYDWMIRASERFSVYYVKEPLVEQYLQLDSISLSSYDKFVASRSFLLKKYHDLCAQDAIFELYLLKQLAHYKSLAGMDATKEYTKILSKEKNLHNVLCVILSKTGLMKLLRSH